MNSKRAIVLATCLTIFILTVVTCEASLLTNGAPLRVLLVTGGCWHNYTRQTTELKAAFVAAAVPVDWTVKFAECKDSKTELAIFDNPTWADGFDVVIHNGCWGVTNPAYIRRITDAHQKGANAVVIHCAMHSFRDATIDNWRQFLGVRSYEHEAEARYRVRVVERFDHIMKSYPDGYIAANDELYVIDRVLPVTRVLAYASSSVNGQEHAVFWKSYYGKARVFGTTFGHSDATFADGAFTNTVVRGALWAARRLVYSR